MTQNAKMPRSGVSEIQALFPMNSTAQTITLGAAAAQSTNAVQTNVVRLACGSAIGACVTLGTANDAATTDMYIPPNGVEYFKVTPNDGTIKVSAIAADGATAGTLYITEMN